MTNTRKLTKEARAEYLERKKKLFEIEKNNFERIVFMKSTRGYWGIFGHSAIMFANKFGPDAKIRAIVRKDSDFDVKFKEGVITLRNVEFYRKKMEESPFMTLEKADDEFVVFKLKKKISEKEYEILKHSKEIRREQLESMIVNSIPLPKLHMRLTEVLQTTYRFYTKRTDELGRRFVVDKFADEVRAAHKLLIMSCRKEISLREGLLKIKALLSRALLDLNQITSLEIWSVEDCTLLTTMIVETQLLVEEELKKTG